jgi:hypothetical protein
MTNYFFWLFFLVVSNQFTYDAVARRMRHHDYEYWQEIGQPFSYKNLDSIYKIIRLTYSLEILNFCKKYKFQYLLYYLWINIPMGFALFAFLLYQKIYQN